MSKATYNTYERFDDMDASKGYKYKNLNSQAIRKKKQS